VLTQGEGEGEGARVGSWKEVGNAVIYVRCQVRTEGGGLLQGGGIGGRHEHGMACTRLRSGPDGITCSMGEWSWPMALACDACAVVGKQGVGVLARAALVTIISEVRGGRACVGTTPQHSPT